MILQLYLAFIHLLLEYALAYETPSAGIPINSTERVQKLICTKDVLQKLEC